MPLIVTNATRLTTEMVNNIRHSCKGPIALELNNFLDNCATDNGSLS